MAQEIETGEKIISESSGNRIKRRPTRRDSIQTFFAGLLVVVGLVILGIGVYQQFSERPINAQGFSLLMTAFMLIVLGIGILKRERSTSALLSPRLPYELLKEISFDKDKLNADSSSPEMKMIEFEDLRTKIRFELKKTKIAVEYSNLSISSKSQCNSLLLEAEGSLSKAQSIAELRYIGELITLASDLVNAIKQDSRTVLAYTLLGISLLTILGFFTWGQWETFAFKNHLFGIPVGVFVWSGIGGFVSVLYRYIFQQEEFKEPTIKWLLIRPVIGIVLGTVTYFAFSTGLYVLGEDLAVNKLSENRGLLFLILAFFAGFSDKFALLVLESAIGRITPNWATKSDETDNKKPIGDEKDSK